MSDVPLRMRPEPVTGFRRLIRSVGLVWLTIATACPALGKEIVFQPGAAPGPLDNPLKGWAPYIHMETYQPYSMAYFYVSWRELEPVEGVYRFDKWEREAWETPRAQGKHIIIRLFLDYPEKSKGQSFLPQWLVEKGVKLTPYTELGGGLSPDYENPVLLDGLERLVAAMGKRYDTHPRVAWIVMGTLGFWGEWHTWPRAELFASESTQARIVSAYRNAFPTKKIMARYPEGVTGVQDWLGYHDDSFPEFTDGQNGYEFLPKMRRSGRLENWRHSVVGGEMIPGTARRWLGADFARTLSMTEQAHFTWIGPYCPALDDIGTPAFSTHCSQLVRRIGYEYRLTEVCHAAKVKRGDVWRVSIAGVNQGVAPFYYPWPVQTALVTEDGRVAQIMDLPDDIRQWLPGKFQIKANLAVQAPPGRYRLALGIRDPWTRKPAIRFANDSPCKDGWTLLSRVEIR